MINPVPGVSNVRGKTILARADGSPVTAGTVNYYLQARTGDNAGRWWRGSDSTWQAEEVIAGQMTHQGQGQWSVEIAAGAWIFGVEYWEYAAETGGLAAIVGDAVRCQAIASSPAKCTVCVRQSVGKANMVAMAKGVTASYQRFDRESIVASGQFYLSANNPRPAYLLGTDGHDIELSAGLPYMVLGIDIGAVHVKGTPGDEVYFAGGTW